MDLKRAIWMGALVYFISFIIGIIIAITLGIDFSTATEAPSQVWYMGIIATVIILVFFALWYFKDKKIKPTPKEGFLFGLTVVIVGTIFDAVLIVPYIILSDSLQNSLAYYLDPLFWITLLLILATTTIVGWYLEKKKKVGKKKKKK